VLSCALAAAGCTVGPDYVIPDTAVPATWHATADHGLTATPLDNRLLPEWWVVLDDPLLDDLVARAIEANLDVREARARVREARARRRGARAGDAHAQQRGIAQLVRRRRRRRRRQRL
jgi:outer membrane protein TolC